MRKLTFLLAAITVLVTIAAAACAPAPAAVEQPLAEPPTQQPVVQQPPAEPPTQAAAAPQLAPICQNAKTCKAPTAELAQLDCVNKVPYTNVLVPAGTKFEVLDKSGDFTCSDSGKVSNGKSVVTCTGRQLYGFDLKLTDTSCGGAALQTDTGQCQQGFGYDAAQQCCAPVSGDGGNATVVHVDLGGCPLPRGAATPEKTAVP